VLVCAQPDAHRIVDAARLAYLLDDLDQESHPALERVATVCVQPPIGRGGQKLRDEVAVGGVDLDSVVAGELKVDGRSAEALDDRAHLGGRHLVRHRRIARRRHWRGGERDRVRQAAGRLPAEMDQLAEDVRPAVMHGVATCSQRFDHRLVPRLDDDARGEQRGLVDDRCARDDQADTVSGALRLNRHVAFSDAALVYQPGAHRWLDDPVADRQLPDPPGLEETRVAALLRVDPPHY
jgi:hypothetical protein